MLTFLCDVISSVLYLVQASMATADVNNCKNWCDLEHGRPVKCRHVNSYLPAFTPRVMTTNSPFERFFPVEAQLPSNDWAIRRRITWYVVDGDLRRRNQPALPSQPARQASQGAWDEEDNPLGHGVSMDEP